MITSLIRRTVVAGQAYAAIDIDSPGAAAVAWKADDGWRAGVADGRTVAEGLTERRALNLMHETASHQLDRAATDGLMGVAQ